MRFVSGSFMWESQPCWVTRTSGLNSRSACGTTAWNARIQPASDVAGGKATLIALPSAPSPPVSVA